MITSLRIGGHDDHINDPGVQELLELALTDQLAVGLLTRFLRGDRTVTGQLFERMVALRACPLDPRSTSPRRRRDAESGLFTSGAAGYNRGKSKS